MAQSYLNESATTQSALASVWSNQIEGSAALAAQAAVTRIKAAIQAVVNTAANIKISA
jgi:hypothetical protein